MNVTGCLRGEGEDAVAEVLGVAAGGDGLRLELHLRLQALLGGLVEEQLGAPEGQRRPLGQLAGERGHRAGELRVRMHAVDEPPLQSPRAPRARGSCSAARARGAARSCRGRKYDEEPSGEAAIFEYAMVNFADSAATTRSPESAKLIPPPAAMPLTAMITGFVVARQPRHRPVQVGRQLLDQDADALGIVREVLDVAARAEGLSRRR